MLYYSYRGDTAKQNKKKKEEEWRMGGCCDAVMEHERGNEEF